MAICKECGNKYSKFTTPVSAKGVCRACFEFELFGVRPAAAVVVPAKSNVPEHAPVLKQPWLPIGEIERANPVSRVRWAWFIPRTRSKAVFAFTMACYCVFLSTFISAWAYVVGVARRTHRTPHSSTTMEAFMNLVAAPVIESMILIGIVGLVRKARASEWVQIFIAALFMSVPHATPWWPWAVAVMPGFSIQAGSYL
jgi:hypothetical protein